MCDDDYSLIDHVVPVTVNKVIPDYEELEDHIGHEIKLDHHGVSQDSLPPCRVAFICVTCKKLLAWSECEFHEVEDE
jgi:hypothetical protein